MLPNAAERGLRQRLQRRLKQQLDQLRYALSFADALPQLAALGLIIGLVTGTVIVAFRLLIDIALALLLPGANAEFASLPPLARAALIGGGLVPIYLILWVAGPKARPGSVGHVLDRLHHFQGQMPLANWLVQFSASALALISGQSVGREGPAVHLGAGVASGFGQILRLPNNSRFSLMACGVAAAKLVVSALVLGLGVPGGIIGPTLVTGACIGAIAGIGATLWLPFPTAEPGFYAIIGMAGFMAAVLNAPLAALVAVLELCYNPHMIFPAMLVIVIANITLRSGFGLEGVFMEQLRATGRTLQFQPAQQALTRAGLAEAMTRNLVYARRCLDYEGAKELLKTQPEWIVVDFTEADTRDKVALPAADLAAYLETAPLEVLDLSQPVDLLEIPARRLTLAPIHETANLWEALEAMRASGAEGVYSARRSSPLAAAITGIVTQQSINSYYQA